ncbi:MAG: CHRD domain-containing protein [Candidatus Kapabacteria bacterium]|jgi:hypothetical protein|nr:CHRD domain-containing protein [Candidatus Kapabacteria bacterium]
MKLLRPFLALAAIVFFSAEIATSQQFFTIALDGSDPSQTASTPATGSGWAVLSADKTRLTYTFAFARLSGSPTAAHFHLGGRGVANPAPAQTIAITGNYVTGTWNNPTAAQLDSLLAGKIYVNIHTMQFPGGEIRGQVVPVASGGYSIALSGANTVPTPISTPARGAGYAVLSADSTLTYRATVFGLSSMLRFAHFHYGISTANGIIAQLIEFTDSTTRGTWKLPKLAFDTLRVEGLYMNVHTVNNGGGEIRGQARALSSIVSVRELASNLASQVKITISPNPVADMMTMTFTMPQSGKVRIQLFDALGRSVSETVEGVWNSGIITSNISVGALNAGVYYCRIVLPNGETVARGFVVSR